MRAYIQPSIHVILHNMKKPLIFSLGFIVFVVGAIVLLSANKTDDASLLQDTAPAQTNTVQKTTSDTETEAKEPATTSTAANGIYTEYSEQGIAQAQGTRVLFFHAPWCAQCRSIEKGMTPDAIPSGVTIFKTDYDSNQELRKKYGVTLQTTFVVLDSDGNVAKKYVAYEDPYFESVKKQLF